MKNGREKRGVVRRAAWAAIARELRGAQMAAPPEADTPALVALWRETLAAVCAYVEDRARGIQRCPPGGVGGTRARPMRAGKARR